MSSGTALSTQVPSTTISPLPFPSRIILPPPTTLFPLPQLSRSLPQLYYSLQFISQHYCLFRFPYNHILPSQSLPLSYAPSHSRITPSTTMLSSHVLSHSYTDPSTPFHNNLSPSHSRITRPTTILSPHFPFHKHHPSQSVPQPCYPFHNYIILSRSLPQPYSPLSNPTTTTFPSHILSFRLQPDCLLLPHYTPPSPYSSLLRPPLPLHSRTQIHCIHIRGYAPHTHPHTPHCSPTHTHPHTSRPSSLNNYGPRSLWHLTRT